MSSLSFIDSELSAKSDELINEAAQASKENANYLKEDVYKRQAMGHLLRKSL